MRRKTARMAREKKLTPNTYITDLFPLPADRLDHVCRTFGKLKLIDHSNPSLSTVIDMPTHAPTNPLLVRMEPTQVPVHVVFASPGFMRYTLVSSPGTANLAAGARWRLTCPNCHQLAQFSQVQPSSSVALTATETQPQQERQASTTVKVQGPSVSEAKRQDNVDSTRSSLFPSTQSKSSDSTLEGFGLRCRGKGCGVCLMVILVPWSAVPLSTPRKRSAPDSVDVVSSSRKRCALVCTSDAVSSPRHRPLASIDLLLRRVVLGDAAHLPSELQSHAGALGHILNSPKFPSSWFTLLLANGARIHVRQHQFRRLVGYV